MRQFTLIFLLLVSSTAAFAQIDFSRIKLGLQISPTLSFNRVNDESADVNFSSDGVGGRMIGGAVLDYMLTDNYFISSGLFFVPKRVGLRNDVGEAQDRYKLHYLQIPATMKLFTNEVALDTRIYFQAGFTLDIKLLDDNISETVTYVEDFGFVDSSLLLAAGAEYRYGYNTIFFGGFSYRRGLANVVRNEFAPVQDIVVKNDLFSLDLGIKF
ncbi:MAG: outer membrane beta-barrel protein [Tunicatimonas sp.]